MDDSRRCTATNRAGNRCGKAAIKGGRVCTAHGGKAPQVMNKARQRIMEAADPAAARMVELMASDDERISLAASKDLLDRSGEKPRTEIDITLDPDMAAQVLRDFVNADEG